MIWLNVNAFNYLIQNEEVYIVKENQMQQGRHNLMSTLRGRPYSKGLVYVELVAELVPYTVRTEIDRDGNESPCQEWRNCNEVLRNFVPKSGFKNIANWIDALRPRHHEKHFLYHVYLVHFSGLDPKTAQTCADDSDQPARGRKRQR